MVTQPRKLVTHQTKTHALDNQKTQNINSRVQYGIMSQV